MQFNVALYPYQGSYYISMRWLVMLFDEHNSEYRTEWDGRYGILRIRKGENIFSFFTNRKKFLVSEEEVECIETVTVIQGEILLPLSSFALLNQRLDEFTIIEKPESFAVEFETLPEDDLERDLQELESPDRTRALGDDLGQLSRPLSLPTDERGLRKITHLVIDPQSAALDERNESAKLEAIRDFTFDVAQLIKRALDANGSIVTYITCEENEEVTEQERVNRINASQAQIALILRVGRSEFAGVRGVHLYCANEVIDFEGARVHFASESSSPVAVWLNYLTYQYESLIIAHLIVQEFKRALTMKVHTPHVAPLYLLKRTDMPAVYVEIGYITNVEDLKTLTLEWTKHLVARGLAGSVLAYKRYCEKRLSKKTP